MPLLILFPLQFDISQGRGWSFGGWIVVLATKERVRVVGRRGTVTGLLLGVAWSHTQS
jgi:hypothetical protein